MYRDAIKKGRSQKATKILILLGGATLSAGGGKLAAFSVSDAIISDNEDIDRLLWKVGSTMFFMGLGGILGGAEMIIEGTETVKENKVSLKLNSTSIGLVVNF